MGDFANLMTDGDGNDWSENLSDLTGYNLIPIRLMAVPENYLSLIDENYYFPNSFQTNNIT